MDTDRTAFQDKIHRFQVDLGKAIDKLPLSKKPDYLYNPINYVLSGPGKRLRPILIYLVGTAFNASSKDIMNAALAMEMLHNFTLVHDDIMDEDDFRHGQAAVHAKWDESTAILAGDGMFAFSQLLLIDISVNALKVIKVFNEAALVVCEGQALDKEFEHDSSVKLDQYFSMIEKKTGFLISASARIGGLIGNQVDDVMEKLESYGLNLGHAFQIQDDILEIFSSSQKMGKSLGSDVVEGKQTVLTILARGNNPGEWKRFWDKMSDKNISKVLPELRIYLEQNGILARANSLVEKYISQANLDLMIIPQPYREDMFSFSKLVLNRKK